MMYLPILHDNFELMVKIVENQLSCLVSRHYKLSSESTNIFITLLILHLVLNTSYITVHMIEIVIYMI